MHIEFRLPTGAGGMAAGHFSAMLKKRINQWAEDHNTTVTNYVGGYRIYFEFSKPSDYTLFALSWNPQNQWQRYYLVK